MQGIYLLCSLSLHAGNVQVRHVLHTRHHHSPEAFHFLDLGHGAIMDVTLVFQAGKRSAALEWKTDLKDAGLFFGGHGVHQVLLLMKDDFP